MSSELLIGVARQALYLALLLAAPMVLAGLVVSLIVSAIQAATQVQEPTIPFAPRLAAVLIALALAGPLIGREAVRFLGAILAALPAIT
jgi:flagellar biosynthesis protein FliQ